MYADKAHALALENNDSFLLTQALIQQAVIHNYDNDNELAHDYIYQALSIATQHQYKYLIPEIHHVLGQVLKKTPDDAQKHYNISIKMAEDLGLEELVQKNKIRLALILLHQKKHSELADLFDELLPALEKDSNIDGLVEVYMYMSMALRDLNQKDKALQYAYKSLEWVEKTQNKKLQSFTWAAIGSGIISYYKTFEEAEIYVNKSIQLATQIHDNTLLKANQKRLALLYLNINDIESAQKIITPLLADNKDPDIFKYYGIILSEQKKYSEAHIYYEKAYQLYEADKAPIQQLITLQYVMDNKLAVIGDPEFSRLFYTLDSLNAVIRDKESQNQFYDLETKYRTAEKESELQKKEVELIKTKTNIYIFVAVLILVALLSIFAIIYLRNKQKRKELLYSNQLLKLQTDFNTIELAHLNNQLNPHEIKNLLTSIAPDIITKAPEAYKKMIRLFNVTRASLSNELTQALSIQVQQVDDYLNLQRSISPYPFDYHIEYDEDMRDIDLPRLILKNLAENSLKHGISHRHEEGLIDIHIEQTSEHTLITVKDNGIPSPHHQSTENTGIGFSTYQKLFDMSNKKNMRAAQLSFERKDAWTIVKIYLPSDYIFT